MSKKSFIYKIQGWPYSLTLLPLPSFVQNIISLTPSGVTQWHLWNGKYLALKQSNVEMMDYFLLDLVFYFYFKDNHVPSSFPQKKLYSYIFLNIFIYLNIISYFFVILVLNPKTFYATTSIFSESLACMNMCNMLIIHFKLVCWQFSLTIIFIIIFAKVAIWQVVQKIPQTDRCLWFLNNFSRLHNNFGSKLKIACICND